MTQVVVPGRVWTQDGMEVPVDALFRIVTLPRTGAVVGTSLLRVTAKESRPGRAAEPGKPGCVAIVAGTDILERCAPASIEALTDEAHKPKGK